MLRIVVELRQVRCPFEQVGLAVHHLVELDLSDQRLEVDVVVLDFLLVLLQVEQLLLGHLVLKLRLLVLSVRDHPTLDFLFDVEDVVEAFEFASSLLICTQEWEFIAS